MAQCNILAKNDAHKLVIVFSPRLGTYALIANPFKRHGKTRVLRQSASFATIFDLFTDWVGDNFILH